MQCPPPHCDNKGHRVHQAADVESEKLVDGMGNLNVGDLYGEQQWRCKFSSMVLQCQKFCFTVEF